jgi:hypothetical protein
MTTAVISNYLENKIIDHVLRNTAYTTPGTSIYIAAFTTMPTDAGGGTEVSGGSYARVQVTAWNAPASRATYNTNAINFAQATANWGTVLGIGIFDNSTGGNLLFYGTFTASKAINSGDTLSIAAGDLDISLGGAYSNYLAHALLSHILRNTSYTSPGTSVYSALYTTDPTVADTGTEVTGGSYARKQITAWDSPADGDTENTNSESFVQATASWGTVAYTGIRDASTAGNLLFFGALTASKAVDNGDTFQWAAGALDVTVS